MRSHRNSGMCQRAKTPENDLCPVPNVRRSRSLESPSPVIRLSFGNHPLPFLHPPKTPPLVIPRRSETDEGIFSPSRLPPCKQTLCHLGFSAANAENRPCRSFCPPTRQRFRPFRALYRTRLHPYGHQRHIFRICGRASTLTARNVKSTVPQCFHLRGAQSPSPLSFRGSQRPLLCHSEEVADRRRNLLFIPPACPGTNPLSPRVFRPQLQQINLSSRPQMRKNGPVGHSARRRGNDFVHFRRFAGRVCIRTATRGTFSAFAAGQAVWQPGMSSQLSCRASTSETWSPVLWTMIS